MGFVTSEVARANAVVAAESMAGRYLSWPSGEEWWDWFPKPPPAIPEGDVLRARAVIVTGIRQRTPMKELAATLDSAFWGRPDMVRDWMRVTRWELDNAFAHGRFQAWMVLAREAGLEDPLVRRPTLSNKSGWCQELYLQGGEPRWFRASKVMEGEKRGNLGYSPEDWLPVVGPTHPNCWCPHWEFENDEMGPAIREAADELVELFGT